MYHLTAADRLSLFPIGIFQPDIGGSETPRVVGVLTSIWYKLTGLYPLFRHIANPHPHRTAWNIPCRDPESVADARRRLHAARPSLTGVDDLTASLTPLQVPACHNCLAREKWHDETGAHRTTKCLQRSGDLAIVSRNHFCRSAAR